MREPRLGLMVVVDCEEGLRLRKGKRERPGDCFRRPKTSDDRPTTIAAIVIRWGVKRTPNAMKLDRRAIYTIIRPHANFQSILRTFSSHL